MTRREIMKLLGQGICTAASASTLIAAPNYAGRPSLLENAPSAGSNDGGDASHLSQQDSAKLSARGVLTRLLGERADEFDLAWMPPVDGRMAYRIEASGGKVSIHGSSGVALSRGAYAYLREACNAMVTWGGQHLELPARFPDFAARQVVCPYQFTQYYNVCTFGYTTPFWDWERWKRELDWMALHGITMALALVGQEAVWKQVWESFGVTQTELDRFSTGPAYLPWHWMANINHFDGPLPEGWIGQRKELQKLILGRMRELGITPIAPAFAGFVPKGFKRVYPNAKISTLLWSKQPTIPRETKTFMLHPDEADLYTEVGRRFIQEYRREFGPVDYYLADLFNELEPPVSVDHRYEDLARFAETVYSGIVAGDPNATWVMQGWLFFADAKFWDGKSMQAFLSRVPDDKMIIIDYVADLGGQAEHPIWKASNAFYGKQWMNGMIHAFGGNDNVRGKLPLIATEAASALSSPQKGKLVGWAICPEGIETNEVVYELLTDVGWSEKPVDLDQWIPAYCRARYGAYPDAMAKAWDLLIGSSYGSDSEPWGSHFNWQRRPSLDPHIFRTPAQPLFHQAVVKFLSCAGELGSNQLYRHDLIELVGQFAGVGVDHHIAAACQAHEAGQIEARNQMAKESLEMLLRIDALMNLHPERRLQPWVDRARSFALSPDQLAYYDSDARRILTFWGWPDLNDYAARVWAGLIRDYYHGRWSAFFQGLQDGKPVSMDIWEQNWLTWPYAPSRARPIHDLPLEAASMVRACSDWYQKVPPQPKGK